VKFTRQAELIRQAVAAEQGRVFGTCRADEIVVYASTLTKTGPIYQPMGRAKLGDETGPKQ
jgi:2'-5' RNA ligase